MDIDIEEDSIKISGGKTNLEIKGILSKRHAMILLALILALLGVKEFQL